MVKKRLPAKPLMDRNAFLRAHMRKQMDAIKKEVARRRAWSDMGYINQKVELIMKDAREISRNKEKLRGIG